MLCEEAARQAQTQSESVPKEYSVEFPDEGRLGIQFTETKAPYIVEKVHDCPALAAGKGIQQGDVLIQVDDVPILEHEWETELKPLMLKRPVVFTFRKPNKSVFHSMGASMSSGVFSLVKEAGSLAEKPAKANNTITHQNQPS